MLRKQICGADRFPAIRCATPLLLRFGYQQVFESLAGRADLEVVARGEGRFDENLARPIRTAAAVRAVVPAFHRGTIVYAHGTKAKVVALGIVSDEPESLAGFQIVAGHLPAKPGELAMETSLAAALQIKTGESVRLLTSRGLRSYRVSGLVSLESASADVRGIPRSPCGLCCRSGGRVPRPRANRRLSLCGRSDPGRSRWSAARHFAWSA